MKEYNTERKPRRKLSRYVNIQQNRFSIIYCILFGCLWLGIGAYNIYTEYDELKKEGGILIMLLFMTGFGILFISVGLFQLNKKTKRKNLKERLELEGIRIIVTITKIKPIGIMFKFGSSVIMGRGSGFKICTEYKGEKYESPKIPTNVTKYVKEGDKIPVFIDPQNPTKYYMDIDNINSY